jgi:LPXTG-motif cell wall-anchored protein
MMKRGKREAKRAYGLGRRFLAMFLAMVMCTSMLQLTAFAAQFEDQTMEGYYTVASDGTVGTTTATSVTEDGFTLKKEITQTGKDAFDITLTVETSQTVTTSHPKAATVLVIDLSNSMDYDFGTSTRLAEAKEVAKQFLASYAGDDADAEQWLSVVWFGSGSGVDKDWVNVAGGAGKNSYDNIYSYLDNLNAPHGSGWSKDEGGTNLEAGLKTAQDQLDERKDIVENKNVVLITDGKPTYHMNGGNGSSGSAANNEAAAARATEIKETATLYTVCLAAEDDVCYTGASITVCKHCEQTQDKHTKVTSCDNCGETKEQHDSFRWDGRTYYVCSDAEWPYGYDEYYDEETTLYCADGSHTYSGKTVTGSSVTVGYFLSNDIATSASTAFNASTAADLQAALAAIAGSIESDGYTGEGTTVTDPMGQFIVLGDVSDLSGDGVTASGNTITWELDPAKADKAPSADGKTTTYTYTITYPITLDTAAEGFVEDYYYPTNGYTYLSIPQEGEDPKKIAFLVPGVCGEIPEYNWTVEYYLQNEDSVGGTPTYPADPEDTETCGPVDLWTSVNAPAGYEDKYASNTGDDYTFAGGNPTMQVTPDGANVMRLYYNLVTEDVVVNHYYKIDKINVDGTLVPGSYSDPYVQGPIPCKVNSDYTATPDTKGGTYTLDEKMPNDMTITVTKDGDNVINLYYTRTQDDSVKTSAQVNHVYRTYAYVLGEDGKYGAEPVLQGEPVTEIAQVAPLVYATTKYDVGTAPIEGYEDYILNTSEGHYSELAANGMTFIIAAKAEDNVRTLYFDKVIDRRDPVTVTVNHYYTKSVTSVVDGEVVTTVDPNGVKGNTSTIDAYAGETFTASEINDYNGDEYISDPGNAGKLVIRTLPAADSVIDLYYTINRAPEEGSITVNHYWRTFTEVTVEDIDEETGEVIGTDIVIKETVNHSEEGIVVEDLYVGQKYTAPQKSWGEGYFFNADDSKNTGTVGTDRVLNLYYDKWAEDDDRNDATIDVQHIYTTYLTTIVNGAVQTLTVTADPVEEPFEGLAGDEFTAVPKFMYNGDEYNKITADAALSVILQPGTNDTIVINYEREARNLVEVPYTVNYEYRTYTMTVNEEGVAGYWTDPAITNDSVSGKGYVDQKITLDPKSNGFDPVAEEPNPAVVQTLKEEGNTWTFVYAKYVPLSAGSVIVNHHYSQQTINLDGSVTWTSNTVTMDPVVKYLGETYTAEPIKNGYDKMDAILDAAAFAANEADKYVLTVSGNHVVDFHYKKVVDYREFATYTVTHDYYLYDYDGTLLSHPEPMTDTYTGYVEHPVTAHPQDTDYTLTKVTFNGEVLAEAPYTEYLVEDENAFVFTYVKTLPQDKVNVKVIHNYYKDEASMSGETAEVENQYVETITEIPEDTAYTAAEHVLEDAAYTYTFYSADPETKTITATDDGENVIIMNYIRATAEYEVIHIYNRNGVEEGRTSAVLGGLDGEVILAENITPVPVYEGYTYNLVSISDDIILNANADEIQTITLVYNRTTGGGGGGGTIIIPEPPVPQDPAPQPEPQPEPEVVIPDEDVPLVEIPEEEVPLVDVPKTGDASALWLMMSVLSGTSLAGVSILGRKKREEI